LGVQTGLFLLVALLVASVIACSARVREPSPQSATTETAHPRTATHPEPSVSEAVPPATSAPTPENGALPASVDAGRADAGASTPHAVVDEKGCIADPVAHGAQWILEKHGAELAKELGRAPTSADVTDPHCFGSYPLADLDGDGTPELEVSSGCAWGVHAALHVLYFSNRGCRKLAGDLVDGELRPLATRSHGVLDIEATWSNGCAGNDYGWQRYRWNGKRYALAEHATCNFCDDPQRPVGANRHPHCQKELAERRRQERDGER